MTAESPHLQTIRRALQRLQLPPCVREDGPRGAVWQRSKGTWARADAVGGEINTIGRSH